MENGNKKLLTICNYSRGEKKQKNLNEIKEIETESQIKMLLPSLSLFRSLATLCQ